MNSDAVARRYARALYELAGEAGVLDTVQQQLDVLAQAVASADADALVAGSLPAEVRTRLGEKLSAGFGPDSLFARFVKVLAMNDRLAEAPRVVRWFSALRDEAEGRVRASVTSATPLTDAGKSALEGAFSRVVGKKVIPEIRVDASLLGGVIVEIDGRVYDGSLKSGIRRLSQKMAGRSSGSAE